MFLFILGRSVTSTGTSDSSQVPKSSKNFVMVIRSFLLLASEVTLGSIKPQSAEVTHTQTVNYNSDCSPYNFTGSTYIWSCKNHRTADNPQR